MLARNVTGVVKLAGLGGIAATVCDANHVATGTLAYPRPVLFGQAWWVLPGFFVGFVLMGASYLVAGSRVRRTAATEESCAPGTVSAFVEAMTSFVLVYLMSGFGNESPAALSLVFYGAFAVRWAFTYERARGCSPWRSRSRSAGWRSRARWERRRSSRIGTSTSFTFPCGSAESTCTAHSRSARACACSSTAAPDEAARQ